MSTYIDKLSMLTTEDDEQLIDNEVAEQLLGILFNYVDFVTLQMNYKQTGVFDKDLFRNSILHVYHSCNGIADIQQCCYICSIAIEEVDVLQQTMLDVIKPLIQRLSGQ